MDKQRGKALNLLREGEIVRGLRSGVSPRLQLPGICAAKHELISRWDGHSINMTHTETNRKTVLLSFPAHRSPIRGLGIDASGTRSGLQICGR